MTGTVTRVEGSLFQGSSTSTEMDVYLCIRRARVLSLHPRPLNSSFIPRRFRYKARLWSKVAWYVFQRNTVERKNLLHAVGHGLFDATYQHANAVCFALPSVYFGLRKEILKRP